MLKGACQSLKESEPEGLDLPERLEWTSGVGYTNSDYLEGVESYRVARLT